MINVVLTIEKAGVRVLGRLVKVPLNPFYCRVGTVVLFYPLRV